MKIDSLKGMLRAGLSIGLAVLGLSVLWLCLAAGQQAMATAPIAGDPVSTGGGVTILVASHGVTTVVAADLDNDDQADLAFGDGNDVRIVANESTTATASWTSSVTVMSMSAPVADLAAADFDRDGLVDLAVATADGSGIGDLRLLRNPASPFATSWSQSQTLTSSAQLSLQTVVAGDLDGDGAPDLASAGSDGVIRLWHNPLTDTQDFGTTWGSPAEITTSDGAVSQIVLADVDRDNLLDIVAVSSGSTPRVRAWRNPGTPFSSVWSTTNLLGNLSDDGLSLAVSDLDHDGAPDVAVGVADGSIRIWRNPLTGTQPFNTSWGTGVGVESGTGPVETLQAADVDNDGYPELIRGTGGASPSLVVWHSRRAPFAGTWHSHTVGTPGRAFFSIAVADLDLDGDVDFASGDAGALLHWPNALLHRNVPFGNETLVGAQSGSTVVLAVGDLDRDGQPDLIVVNHLGEICLWRNDGTPFVTGWASNRWDIDLVRSLALADLDGDGDLDLVTGQAYASDDDWGQIRVWRNDGTPFAGSWSSTDIGVAPHDDFTETWHMALATGDLDRDGGLEIVVGTGGDFGLGSTDPVSRSTDFGLYIWRFSGDPFSAAAWSSSTISITLDAVNAVALGDLDNDGWLDLVAGTNHAPAMGTAQNPVSPDLWPDVYELRAFRNDGTPFDGTWPDVNVGRDLETYTFGDGIYHGYYGASTFAVVLADLDNDGDLDIASGESWAADHQVKVWENDGTPFDGDLWDFSATGLGPWWPPDPWLSQRVNSLAAADVNQDGLVDLVSTLAPGAFPVSVVYWENSGLPFSAVSTDTHWIRHNVGVTDDNSIEDVVAVDLDRDGDLDLAVAHEDVYVWRNQGGAVNQRPVDTAPVAMIEDVEDDLLRVVLTHNGKWMDHDVGLGWWRLMLADGTGTPLTSAQAAALFEDIRVYRDDGDDIWEGASADTLVVSVTNLSLGSGGLLSITFPVHDPLTTLSVTQQATYFVAATLQPDASLREPPAFQVIFDPDAASLVRDQTTVSSVSIEDTDPVIAGPVSISAGPPVTVSVVASSSAITADGTSAVVITATVTNARGHPVDDGTVVSFTTSLGSIAPLTSTTTSGVVTTTLTSTTTLGTATITATAGAASGNTGVQFVSALPAHVVMAAWPGSIVADGTSTAVVTATVTDAYWNVVDDGVIVAFTTTLGSVSPSALTTGGVATATLTSSTDLGTAIITATAGDASGSTSVQFVPGPPMTVTVAAAPTSIVADGSSTAVVTATVTDAQRHPVADDTSVAFASTLGSISPSALTTGGVATATLTSSTDLGTAVITVTVGAASDDTSVQFVPGPLARVAVVAMPVSIVADGSSTAVVTATAVDAQGHPIARETTVSFTTTRGSISPSMRVTSGAVATATLTSSTDLGTAVITATAEAASGDTSVQFIPGPLARVAVTAMPVSIVADGSSTAVVTATAVDAQGHRIARETTVNFTTTLGSISPLMRVTSGAAATATLTSSTDLGTAVITATAEAASGDTSVQFVLGPPMTVTVAAAPTSIVANGSSKAVVTATVIDAQRRPVADGTSVAFTSTLGSISPSALTTGGVATAILTSSTDLGTAIVTVTSGSAAGQTSVQFVPGPLAQIVVSAQPSTLRPDGTSEAAITASLTDGNGHLVTEATTVAFSTTLGVIFPATKMTSSGIATATLQAPTEEGTATVTARVADISGQASVQFTGTTFIYLPFVVRSGS